jgi:hypothetical protein
MEYAADSVAQREPKATVMMDKMLALEDIVNRACELRDKVQHGPQGTPNATVAKLTNGPAEMPSVTSVLTTGPEILQSHYNRMMDLIEQIEQDLF